MPARLDAYRRKRDLDATPEPDAASDPADAPGSTTATGGRFVVHEHHARRLHWDLRLEHDGVLASWAIPNGIPEDPAHNRKAIHVEDHPLEYLDFAGTIPAGSYGAGEILVWDHGTYVHEKWRDDELIVVFSGERLTGRYALFQTGGGDRDWMIHRMDPPLDPEAEEPPEQLPPMLATPGRLPRNEDQWGFEVKWDGVRAIARSQPGRLHLASRSDRDITHDYPELRGLNTALGSRSAILDGEIIAFDDRGRPSFQALQPRIHAHGASARRLAAENPVTYMLFDLLWLDGHSLLDLPYAQRRERLEALELDGAHWQTPPSHRGEGRALLRATADQQLEGVVAKRLDAPYRPGRRSSDWVKVKHEQRQEFVVGGYTPGNGARESSFGALQLGVHDDEGRLVHVGGVGSGFKDDDLERLSVALRGLERQTSPFAVGAPPRGTVFVTPKLVVEVTFGQWTSDDQLRHAVFRGLRDDRDPATVVRELPREPDDRDDDQDGPSGAHDGRESREDGDRAPRDDDADRPSPDDANAETAAARDRNGAAPRNRRRKATSGSRPAGRDETPVAIPERGDHQLEVDGRSVRLTNLDKPLYPAAGLAKSAVIDYYARIAPVLLPHLRDRPVTLKRYPDGVDGKAFYEKHANRHRPEWVATTPVPSRDGDPIDYVLIQDLPTLLWAANLAALELHPSLSRGPAAPEGAAPHEDGGRSRDDKRPQEDDAAAGPPPLGPPTALVFDLDPGAPATIVECCRVALEIRALLDDLGLRGHAKTSGSKGLQLYVPLAPEVGYDRSGPFAHAVASLLEQRDPERVVSRMAKRLRPGKVLIDWSQNDPHKTTVSVYSLRAREQPTVSTPVDWDEVSACATADDPERLVFTADDVLRRVAADGDRFADLLRLDQQLPELTA